MHRFLKYIDRYVFNSRWIFGCARCLFTALRLGWFFWYSFPKYLLIDTIQPFTAHDFKPWTTNMRIVILTTPMACIYQHQWVTANWILMMWPGDGKYHVNVRDMRTCTPKYIPTFSFTHFLDMSISVGLLLLFVSQNKNEPTTNVTRQPAMFCNVIVGSVLVHVSNMLIAQYSKLHRYFKWW